MRVIVTLTVLAAACSAPRYSYRPTAAARTDVRHGEIELAAIGVEKIKPPWRGAHDQPMVHVRMIARNGSGEPWVIDGYDQNASIAGRQTVQPRFSTCDGVNTQPAVLMPGETRTVDLYYPWPAGLPAGKKLPPVVVEWRVRTPARVIAQATTAFEPHARPKPVVVVPPPDPHQMARQLDARPVPLDHDGITR